MYILACTRVVGGMPMSEASIQGPSTVYARHIYGCQLYTSFLDVYISCVLIMVLSKRQIIWQQRIPFSGSYHSNWNVQILEIQIYSSVCLSFLPSYVLVIKSGKCQNCMFKQYLLAYFSLFARK